jgi:hypothetical protein
MHQFLEEARAEIKRLKELGKTMCQAAGISTDLDEGAMIDAFTNLRTKAHMVTSSLYCCLCDSRRLDEPNHDLEGRAEDGRFLMNTCGLCNSHARELMIRAEAAESRLRDAHAKLERVTRGLIP